MPEWLLTGIWRKASGNACLSAGSPGVSAHGALSVFYAYVERREGPNLLSKGEPAPPASLISLPFAVVPGRGQLVMVARLPLGLASQPERVGQTCQGSARG
jgi:hypothetical protein